ncbi:hypothetical protein Tco_0061533, partial [Tanacetum coccineum]
TKGTRTNKVVTDIKNVDVGPSFDKDIVTEIDSYIISDTPDMEPNRGTEEHDNANYEKNCALIATLIKNLQFDVEKCNTVNREAKQKNVLKQTR